MKVLDQLREEAPEFMEEFEANWDPPNFYPSEMERGRECGLCSAIVLSEQKHTDWHLALSARLALDFAAIHLLGSAIDMKDFVAEAMDEHRSQK